MHWETDRSHIYYALRFWQTYLCIPGLQGFEIKGTAIRGLGPGGIPVAVPDGIAPVTGAAHYYDWLEINDYGRILVDNDL
jgi:hypothetical protein